MIVRKEDFVMKKILILIIMIVLGMAVSINAKGNDDKNVKAAEKVYQQNLDKNLVNVVRTSLEKEGYFSCGITLSSVTKLNENKEYTVKIHHDRISNLSDDDKDMLMARLEKITYPYDKCRVNYLFEE